jgi:hypothetical protein
MNCTCSYHTLARYLNEDCITHNRKCPLYDRKKKKAVIVIKPHKASGYSK